MYEVAFKPEGQLINLESCIKDLRQFLNDRVSVEECERLLSGRDWWPLGWMWLMKGKVPSVPDVVVWPNSTEEVAQVVKTANWWGIPVTPFGEGSGVLGGVVPVKGGIVLDMKRMNRVVEIDEKSLLVTVETGINGVVLERKLNAKGYTLRHVPQSVRASTVGGWVACRAAGQFSTKYGKIEDILVGIEAVTPNGAVYRNTIAPRTAAGPRVDQLFLGAEGTLGVVTKAVLHIWPLPEAKALRSFTFATVDDALEAVREIMRSHIRPAVVRIYDAGETEHHFKDVPEAHERVMLVLVMEGLPEMVAAENSVAERFCLKWGGVDCGEGPVQHWFESRFNISLSSNLLQNGVVLDTMEVSATWTHITNLYHQVIKNLKEIPGTIMAGGHFSHVYPDGACLYLTVIGAPQEDPEGYYKKVWDTAMNTTHECGGTMAHHHGVGLNRARFMIDEHGDVGIKLLQSIKQAWDPHNILNPGKLGLEVKGLE